MAERNAVIVGAGIGGLAAAQAVAADFDNVTIVERDVLTPDTSSRNGVRHGHHYHGLVGQELFARLFPGILDKMEERGAPRVDMTADVRASYFGNQLLCESTGLQALMTSQPFLEKHLRNEVASLSNVSIFDRCTAGRIITASKNRHVTGIHVSFHETPDTSPQLFPADLVVDATGRAARARTWLSDLGLARPIEESTAIRCTYTTCHFSAPPDAFGPQRTIVAGPTPQCPRGFFLAAQEDSRWVFSLFGYGPENKPSNNLDEFLTYSRDIVPPDVWDAMRQLQPDDQIVSFHYPATRRLHYQRHHNMPEGLVCVGDSLCTTSPIYGAGMTMAAMQALILKECLRDHPRELQGRFHRKVYNTMRPIWHFTRIADSVMPGVSKRPEFVNRLVGKLMTSTTAAAAHDLDVMTAIVKALTFNGSPSKLLKPKILHSIVAEIFRKSHDGPRVNVPTRLRR
nr:FAD-dependent monooxygenase [Kibdelosporangium sp. MJ126-NF4]